MAGACGQNKAHTAWPASCVATTRSSAGVICGRSIHSVRAWSTSAGVVASLGAIRVGLAALHLGAGRRTKEDAVDHAVGVVCLKKRGDAVREGEPLAEVHARDHVSADQAAADVLAAYELADAVPPAGPIVLEVLT